MLFIDTAYCDEEDQMIYNLYLSCFYLINLDIKFAGPLLVSKWFPTHHHVYFLLYIITNLCMRKQTHIRCPAQGQIISTAPKIPRVL